LIVLRKSYLGQKFSLLGSVLFPSYTGMPSITWLVAART